VLHLKTLTRPHSSTWETEGFKELVAYAKCNPDFYGSVLGFSVSYFSVLCSLVILLEDEQNLVVGVFVYAKNALFLQYFYTRLMLIIIVIFRFSIDVILFGRF